MEIGTKSLLLGAHQFVLHPLFTAAGWIGCYGFCLRGYSWWRLIICFVIHDWGYWGCSNMDGDEGEGHPRWAALRAWKYLDGVDVGLAIVKAAGPARDFSLMFKNEYYNLCLYHSRFYAIGQRHLPSDLCWADKLGTTYMSTWLWVFLTTLTGEVTEYMSAPKHVQVVGDTKNPYVYFEAYKKYIKEKLKEVL